MNLTEFMVSTTLEFPSFKMVSKKDSFLMKVISVLLFLVTFGQQSTFMSAFVTTLGYTVYVPEGWDLRDEKSKLVVLRHERVHMRQARRLSRYLFSFLYMFVFFPLGLAYFRAIFEWEAYTESLRAYKEYYGAETLDNPNVKEAIVQHFVSGQYGWMWPFRSTIERWYDETVKKIQAE